MGAGKLFCILGGIITLVSMYLFSFGSIEVAPGVFVYASQIGFFMNLGLIFQAGSVWWTILAIVFIIFSASGILIILGIKSRVPAIVGAIFVLAVGGYILSVIFLNYSAEIESFYLAAFADGLVPGFIPLDIPLHVTAGTNVSLGLYLLLGGGVLGLIGGIMGPDEY
ncbi:MAG: hypothetical protein ACFE9S_03980 [Candidatus Hermodarchaeota archaeon]